MTNKQQQYEQFLPMLKGLVEGISEEVSIMANVAAALHEEFGWFWTGFYIVKNKNKDEEGDENTAQHLSLGPFQGPVACYTIAFGRGVCGTAWKRSETIVVHNVEEFPGHIACSSLSRSEIVVPIIDSTGRVRAVLDIDSKELGTFDDTDRHYLEQAMRIVADCLYSK